MTAVTAVGLDLAKHIFPVHGIDADGRVAVRRPLPRCLVGMEACASSHFWAREITALGHDVRLMPPAYVKPYAKRGKTDVADAEAICEAVTRPTMRFVAIKSVDRQAVLMLHKARELLVHQRTMLINAMRAHLAELGLIAAQGPAGRSALLQTFEQHRAKLPQFACTALDGLMNQGATVNGEIERLEKLIVDWHRTNEASRRLATIPGIGPIPASAIAASVPDPALFRSGRQFAA
jgi:transposase